MMMMWDRFVFYNWFAAVCSTFRFSYNFGFMCFIVGGVFFTLICSPLSTVIIFTSCVPFALLPFSGVLLSTCSTVYTLLQYNRGTRISIQIYSICLFLLLLFSSVVHFLWLILVWSAHEMWDLCQPKTIDQ